VSEAVTTIGLIMKGLAPVWRAVKFIRDAASKKYLLPLYERSDRLYRNRNALGARWEPLTEYLEYTFEMVNIFDHKNGRKQSISIRKSQNIPTPIDSVTLIITAHNKGYVESERIVFDDVDEIPKVHTLQNIPITDLYVKNDGFYPTYDHISIKIKDIISGGAPLRCYPDVIAFWPTYFSTLNHTYTEKWGRFWNLGLFDDAKKELHKVIIYLLDVQHIMPWSPKTIWDRIRMITCAILTYPVVLNSIFWTAVIFHVINIDDNGDITPNARWLKSLARKLLKLKRPRVYLAG
jgi:hypothetical protein